LLDVVSVVAMLRSSFFSSLNNCVAVYPERSGGSHSCTAPILLNVYFTQRTPRSKVQRKTSLIQHAIPWRLCVNPSLLIKLIQIHAKHHPHSYGSY